MNEKKSISYINWKPLILLFSAKYFLNLKLYNAKYLEELKLYDELRRWAVLFVFEGIK